jgi:two-component system LytT family sensor kinase
LTENFIGQEPQAFIYTMNSSAISKIISHVVAWLLFFALIMSVTASMGSTTFAQQLISLNFYVFCFIYLFVFYLNSILLFPHLYLEKRYFIYFLVNFALGFIVFLLTPFDNLLSHSHAVSMFPRPMPSPPGIEEFPHRPPPGQPGRGRHFIDINSLIIFLLVWLASMALQISKEWRTSQQRAILAESDKKAAELAFLKAHINPHFLFNTLNNIYSLAIINHEETAVSILKLSNIMRYVTESVTTDFISLENEVECIVDYVDLQKLRLNKKAYLDFSITGSAQDKVIAPLILISFIENVFKYGVSNHHQSTLTIKLFMEENNITFYCQNRIFNPGYTYDREGWGIANTRRRLEYLYPEKHSLKIDSEKGLYTVQLTLNA